MAGTTPANEDKPSPIPAESIENDEEPKEEDAEEGDAEGSEGISRELYREMRVICDTVSNYRITVRGDQDHYPSTLFRRLPNKKHVPEYHAVIQEPRAISTLKSKSQGKKYADFAEYVRDFALIVHNAQVYNRPNSNPVKDVMVVKEVFEKELVRLVGMGLISEEDTVFPDLGEIPDATPEDQVVSEEEEEDDDEDDEGEESDDEEKPKRGRRGRPSTGGRKRNRSEDGQKDGEARKRRGRPPRVDTPMEARIKAVLKGIRKLRSEAGHLKVAFFERVPDKTENPDYYNEIKNPISIEAIKQRQKRKKYQSLEHFMKDMELMFSNAMSYNEDESVIYQDAQDLWEEAQRIAEIEKKKPDSEYLMEDGRMPLPNGILHNGNLWQVGDWVHIKNPNDVTKPIVAQIYRTWQDPEDQKWVNACWYYRPEQTVHQYEKHFFPHEVVKTGQYRDHRVEEILDRCFVMFITRYSRGRPRGLAADKEIYVCEARYNEEKHKLNKIKTWASCLPDEVRDKDYEMDMYKVTRKIKKRPSPIKHLLKADAKETDPLPSPQWGKENAPPIVGAVHRQPRDENQSPPPEPTPPPSIVPPSLPRQLSSHVLPRPPSAHSVDAQGDIVMANPSRVAPGTPQHLSHHTPGHAYPVNSGHASMVRSQQMSQVQAGYSLSHPQTPSHIPQSQLHAQARPNSAQVSAYNAALAGQAFTPRGIHPTTGSQQQQQQHQQFSTNSQLAQSMQHQQQPQSQQPQRQPEVFVMSDAANAALPEAVRERFPTDDKGRVLWFTNPPLNTQANNSTNSSSSNSKKAPLQHTQAYLEAREKRNALIAERKRQAASTAQQDTASSQNNKGLSEEGVRAFLDKVMGDLLGDSLEGQDENQNQNHNNQAGKQAPEAEKWAEYDSLRAKEAVERETKKREYFEGKERERAEREVKERNEPTRFEDDWDERY